ncbi:MAG: hypothetical protein QOG98_3670, partial [Pseudonocardiales bacterium]|nr:hypothetical protein [Pseudonocardiales bacterium]
AAAHGVVRENDGFFALRAAVVA